MDFFQTIFTSFPACQGLLVIVTFIPIFKAGLRRQMFPFALSVIPVGHLIVFVLGFNFYFEVDIGLQGRDILSIFNFLVIIFAFAVSLRWSLNNRKWSAFGFLGIPSIFLGSWAYLTAAMSSKFF